MSTNDSISFVLTEIIFYIEHTHTFQFSIRNFPFKTFTHFNDVPSLISLPYKFRANLRGISISFKILSCVLCLFYIKEVLFNEILDEMWVEIYRCMKLTNAICEFYVDFSVCVCGKFILLTCRKKKKKMMRKRHYRNTQSLSKNLNWKIH